MKDCLRPLAKPRKNRLNKETFRFARNLCTWAIMQLITFMDPGISKNKTQVTLKCHGLYIWLNAIARHPKCLGRTKTSCF